MDKPIIQLNGWVTIADLAKTRGCSTQNLSKFIKKGKLPVIIYPELNGLKLVPEDWKPE